MGVLLLASAATLSAAVLTGVVRRYSVSRAVLDVPNERSSHTVPTPRGGGLAIVITLLAAMMAAWIIGWVPRVALFALAPAGALVAAIGWIDDHRSISARWRLVAHFAAASWTVYLLGGLPIVQLGTITIKAGAGGSLFAIITIVWLTNLYNFMDGIDGIAATEAVIVGFGAAALAIVGGAYAAGILALLIAASTIGFLGWNWQPARIFMGDVGSGFLGFMLGATAVFSEQSGGPPMLLWGLLLGVFVIDATLTLLRRGVRGEALSAAHRRHAYQRAVQSGLSHAQVAITTAVLNLLLLACAANAWLRPGDTWFSVGGGYALLLTTYLLVERRRPMFTQSSTCDRVTQPR